ncbi:MAG: glycosyltransferase family 2 protein [Lachnospiraceae bacterium]|nr:glycosyltransferase family 2 protein [Lachnospiraceae bacterium]
MDKRELVSVIVPIYNAEKCLYQCIKSILDQTYADIEVVLVNDGSTDNSLEICRSFADNDSRIKIIDQENGGIVSARKAGLLASSGKYIGWVDADDWIEEDYIRQLVKAQREGDADIVAAGHYRVMGDKENKAFNNIPTGTYSPEMILSNMLYYGEFFKFGIYSYLWNKLFKRDILEKVLLGIDEYISGLEDAATVYPGILEAKKIAVTDICCYHYVQNPGSFVRSTRKDDKEYLKAFYDHMYKAFKNKGVDHILVPQLDMYYKFLVLTRKIDLFDLHCPVLDKNTVLYPYGGIKKGCRVVIYGAGVMGEKLVQCMNQEQIAVPVLWVDQNYSYYQSWGMEVEHPQKLASLNESDYDHILIANAVSKTAQQIRSYLVEQLSIPGDKIRWLSQDFIDEKIMINQ